MATKEIIYRLDKLDKELVFEDFQCEDELVNVHILIAEIKNMFAWHYPSKGEYPTEDGFYLVTCDPLFEGGHRFVCMCSYASIENRWIDSRG